VYFNVGIENSVWGCYYRRKIRYKHLRFYFTLVFQVSSLS